MKIDEFFSNDSLNSFYTNSEHKSTNYIH